MDLSRQIGKLVEKGVEAAVQKAQEELFRVAVDVTGKVIQDIKGKKEVDSTTEKKADHTFRDFLLAEKWKKVDYSRLDRLLAAGKWEKADRETTKIMCQVVGREDKGWLTPESMDIFPCQGLRTIDQLWKQYSKGKFGFSNQKDIYQDICQSKGEFSPAYYIWRPFCVRVGWSERRRYGDYDGETGWLSYSDLTFDHIKAPIGHLPYDLFWCEAEKLNLALSIIDWLTVGPSPWCLAVDKFRKLYRRLITCEI
jgi:hypothetical protein